MSDDDVTLLMTALAIEAGHRPAVARAMTAVGGLNGLWRAGAEPLDPIDLAVAARWSAVCALWRRAVGRGPPASAPIDGPESLLACLDPLLPLSPAESFYAVFLDGRGRFSGVEEVGRGSVDACLVHPREVFAPAIRARAAAVAVVHNHPSGDPTPSRADLALTDRLAAAGRLLGIPLVDHVVVGRGGHRSLGPGAPDEAVVTGDRACEHDARCGAYAWRGR